MEAMFVPQRQVNRAGGGDHGGPLVTDVGMIGDVRGTCQSLSVGADGRFVFAVGTDRQGGFGKDPLEGLLLVDQQSPVLLPMKILMPGTSVARVSSSTLSGVAPM